MMRARGRHALRSAVVLGAVVCLAAGCGPRTAQPPASVRSSSLERAPAEGERLAVTVRAPDRAPWVSSTLGPTKPTLDVVITNLGRSPADVSGVHVHLEAVRRGVSFRCADSVGPPAGGREPSTIAPGETIELERTLDCSLPLTGEYEVRVAVSFGRGSWEAPRLVRAFTLDVSAPEHFEPKPVAAVPGLHAAIGSSSLLVGETGAGAGRIAVSLVKGGAAPIALPRLRLALRVHRAGSPIPCEDEPIALAPPAVLQPGDVHREPIAVSCLGLGVPGKYEVVARLLVGPEPVESEIGRLGVEISNDPSRRMPPIR